MWGWPKAPPLCEQHSAYPRLAPALLCALLLAGACSTEQVADSQIELPALASDGWPQAVVMRGTPLDFHGAGFLDPALATHRVHLDGGIQLTLDLQWIDAQTLRYVVDDALLTQLAKGSRFEGRYTIVRELTETGRTDSVDGAAAFDVVDNLTPVLTALRSPGDVFYPGDTITLEGDGFLLPGEGHTFLELEGSFETKVPPETRVVRSTIPANGTSRTELSFVLNPADLGIRPGTFSGRIDVTNAALASDIPGQGLEDVVRTLEPPRIDAVMPPLAARGQRIQTVGRGFLATDPALNATTLIRLEGEFTIGKTGQSQILEGPTALALFPDNFDGNTAMEYVLRVTQTPAGELSGLGLVAGSFKGRVTPLLISGAESIVGLGAPFEINIAPQRQLVYVKFLPGFSTTVHDMGLSAVEDQVKARVLAVCNRDYSGVSIEFRSERPTDFVEYSIIEVGGQDPNDAGLFGLDNTTGKDIGNLRFNDIIGGANAETAEQGYYAFGGVFVQSFYQLSPSIPGVTPLPIASDRFDDVFGHFMPALGGSPATDSETGSRSLALDDAVRVLGNLVGNTVSHEIGHSLGLSNIDGEFHNIGDNDGWIMDAGSFRPFAERAELDGEGPAVFSPNNRSYLERILPVE